MVRLQEELAAISLLDRLHDYNTEFDREFHRDDNGVHAARQKRRFEILAEISRLEGEKPGLESLLRESAISR
ncbi:MAG TPA: hypothetical protein VJX16_12450 [Terriglobales bacterium]|nr:hypothetical protein [Terriglobales bacterium]